MGGQSLADWDDVVHFEGGVCVTACEAWASYDEATARLQECQARVHEVELMLADKALAAAMGRKWLQVEARAARDDLRRASWAVEALRPLGGSWR